MGDPGCVHGDHSPCTARQVDGLLLSTRALLREEMDDGIMTLSGQHLILIHVHDACQLLVVWLRQSRALSLQWRSNSVDNETGREMI